MGERREREERRGRGRGRRGTYTPHVNNLGGQRMTRACGARSGDGRGGRSVNFCLVADVMPFFLSHGLVREPIS